jgi:hypothetical protein
MVTQVLAAGQEARKAIKNRNEIKPEEIRNAGILYSNEQNASCHSMRISLKLTQNAKSGKNKTIETNINSQKNTSSSYHT